MRRIKALLTAVSIHQKMVEEAKRGDKLLLGRFTDRGRGNII